MVLTALVKRSANEGHGTDAGDGLLTDSRLNGWKWSYRDIGGHIL